jgi:hypothetical protein
LPPSWLLEDSLVTITRDGDWSLDMNDFVEDANDGFADPLQLFINLGGATLFMTEENGIISQDNLSIEEYVMA